MKVLHLCLAGPFTDGWSYQENGLTKHHKKQGHDVVVVTSQTIWDDSGKYAIKTETNYVNQDGVKVYRLPLLKGKLSEKFKKYGGVINLLEKEQPEILFVHGSQCVELLNVVKYLKNRKVTVYVDNHADFSNSATNWLSKNLLHKILWKYVAKKIEPYTTKFYGVLPARVDFLVDVYGLPKEKCELLVMGADDDQISRIENSNAREVKRAEYNVKDDEILVVTGGKIDLFKQQTLLLMQAVNEMENEKVKLGVFGSVVPEMKEKFDSLLSDRVKYSGWKNTTESYDEFAAADIVVFPGRHSVFWEQVAAIGIPMICKKWAGTTHVDVGGNVIFLENDSVEKIKNAITEMIADYDKYKNAAKTGKKHFLYSDIAKRSIAEIKE
ncbi:MAG: glycosyltransferase family 4 protein [Ruminococcaceae bacterium]|nr:glycosyltransferase family 4 protein [Oscillospiraceae bacterium]